MSTPNPNTVTNSSTDILVNNLIEKALSDQLTNTPQKFKRKPKGQLSEEKTKPPKVCNTSPHTSPPSTPINHTATIMYSDTKYPKMIRHDARDLGDTPCVSAFYTREAILKKDATHPAPPQNKVSYNDTRSKISDHILINKHKLMNILDCTLKNMMIKALNEKDEYNTNFFNLDGEPMAKMTDAAFQSFLVFCDTYPELNKDTNGHYDSAKKALASEISAHIPVILFSFKEDLTPFLTISSRQTALNKELNELIIKGANFDNKWLTVIHDTMPTAKASTTTHTLANTMHTLKTETEKHNTNIIDMEHQITKMSVRLGDLKTSEVEGRHQQVENIIRLHNINTLDEGSQQHFRTLKHPEQLKRIHNLVNEHVSPGVGYSTQIISPREGSRNFESLAIITFLNSNSKFEFEKNFADYRRKNPGTKITSSRPAPQKTTSDRDMPDTNDIKEKIGMLYNQKVSEARQVNPTTEYNPLSSQEIGAIQVQLKTKRKPFSTYWEFLCPSNNTTFMVYTPDKNPFSDYDFTAKIANPLTRKHATSDQQYGKRYAPKIYNRKK